VNTPTTRKKRQTCQVTTQGFSKGYMLTVYTSDLGVGAALLQEGKDDIVLSNCYYFFKVWQKSKKNNPKLKKKSILMYMSSIRGVYWSQYRHIYSQCAK
jgi:hypothetical protein